MKHFTFEEIFHPENPEIVKIAFHVRNTDKYEGEKGAWALLQEDMAKEQRTAQEREDKKDDHWKDMNLSCCEKGDAPIQHLIAFAQYLDYGTDFFIFGGYYVYNRNDNTLERNKEYDEYRGRLVIKRKGKYVKGYHFYYNTIKNKKTKGQDGKEITVGFPEVYALLPYDKEVGAFLGYDKVLLTHKQLSKISHSENGAADWSKALSKIKAVYCVTDTSNGMLYIGSANGTNSIFTKAKTTGDEKGAQKENTAEATTDHVETAQGLWGRWQYYANENDLTGDNKYFNDIIAGQIDGISNGKEHIKNYFTYTILEIFDIRTADIVVLERERFWKKALHTLYPYGMNYNL